MSILEVKNLTKKFGNTVAIQNVNFEVDRVLFITLLGPSGCGKTTTLRCVAGLEKPDTGKIVIDGETMTSVKEKVFVPPHKRKLSMVFQSYAVWPHMTVFDNVAYGLKARKLSKNEIKSKVRQILSLVGIESVQNRYATQLSGGQQQRVSLARSLVLEPKLLLLDEPLSNLDAKLRESMRFELKKLQSQLEMTFLYVTHDQSEAMVVSDRIVVFNEGRIEQIGTSKELYNNPKNKFVADFIGSTNFLEGTLTAIKDDESWIMHTEEGITIHGLGHVTGKKEQDKVLLSIRPEDLELFKKRPTEKINIYSGEIINKTFLGNFTIYNVSIGKKKLAIQSSRTDLNEGKIYVKVNPQKCKLV